jgi:hypothetical protein
MLTLMPKLFSRSDAQRPTLISQRSSVRSALSELPPFLPPATSLFSSPAQRLRVRSRCPRAAVFLSLTDASRPMFGKMCVLLHCDRCPSPPPVRLSLI